MGKTKEFIVETLIYGFGNVFSRFFAFLLIPLYTKYLGKIDYSNLIMLQSTFSILSIFTALNAGVFYYYYEYENLKYRKIVLTSWFYYQILMVSILIFSVLVFSDFFSNLFIITSDNVEQIRLSLIIISLQLIPYIFNNTNINYFRIERNPKKVVKIVLLEALLILVFVFISLQILRFGIIGVVSSQLLARIVVSLVFIEKSIFYLNIKYFSRKLLQNLIKYAWPFVLSSLFSWIILSTDKFIGAQLLKQKTDVALLALAGQLVLPVSILADMIRMAIGPFTMSIRKDTDAEKSYQQIFDLTIFSSSIVIVGIVMLTPILTIILADRSYLNVLNIVPLMAFANIFALAASQFSIYFSLVKKTVYILWGTVIAGITGFVLNIIFMPLLGYLTVGFSQILSYLFMAIFLYFCGINLANLKLKLRNNTVLILELIFFIILIFIINIIKSNLSFLYYSLLGFVFIIILTYSFIKTQKLNIRFLFDKMCIRLKKE
jgi:O-antigen/teichoic acid export membrane protein